ncbi:MAG: tetratricopeptide repeat protein [Chloroflexi bacterium]|nr:tetratricopeptide repeat protein [Chloroflexota bacterium]
MTKLSEHLQTLEKFDLIAPQKSEAGLEYAFKHVFTQESVYSSLLRSDRRELHQQVGEALEALFAATLNGEKHVEAPDDLPLLLAHHFEKSGDIERALKYLKIAAAGAAAGYANEEAIELYSRALALLDDQDYANRWDLLTERETVLDRLGERDRQATHLTLMQTLAELMADDTRLAVTHNRRAAYFDKISEYQAAAEAAEVGLRIARRSGNRRLEAQSLNRLARAAWRRFDYPAVQKWANEALDALKMVGDPATKTTSLLHLGRASYRLGQYDMAMEYIRAALDFTRYTDDQESAAVADLILGWIYQRLGDYALAEKHYRLTLEKRRLIGDRYGEATALSHLGWLAYDQQRWPDGLHYCLEALDISQTIGDRENEAYALTGLGLNHEQLGNLEVARSNYEEALVIHHEIGAMTLAIFDQAGLARSALAHQDQETARKYINAVAEWILAGNAQQFWDPWSIYLWAYQGLSALGEAETAGAILNEAHILLHQRAKAISDDKLRYCFFAKVAVNREIVQAWRQMQGENK